jgi:hypothetical protein
VQTGETFVLVIKAKVESKVMGTWCARTYRERKGHSRWATHLLEQVETRWPRHLPTDTPMIRAAEREARVHASQRSPIAAPPSRAEHRKSSCWRPAAIRKKRVLSTGGRRGLCSLKPSRCGSGSASLTASTPAHQKRERETP